MADVIASLEAGFNERTHVGAASRLRNQILAIDNFMAEQRKADILLSQSSSSSQALPQTQNLILSNYGLPNHRTEVNFEKNATPSVSDANIDPSLQAVPINPTTGALSGAMYQTVSAPGNAFDFPAISSSMNGMSGLNAVAGAQSSSSMDAMATMNGANGFTELQFQIPPELLEGWPWHFDASNGGGGGVGFGGY